MWLKSSFSQLRVKIAEIVIKKLLRGGSFTTEYRTVMYFETKFNVFTNLAKL